MPCIRDDDIIYVSKDPHRTFLPGPSSRYPPPRKKARAAPAAGEASSSQQPPLKPPPKPTQPKSQPKPPSLPPPKPPSQPQPQPPSLPPPEPSPQPADKEEPEVIDVASDSSSSVGRDSVARDSNEGSDGEAEASAEASAGASDGPMSDDDDDTACAKCGRREDTDANPILLCEYDHSGCNGCDAPARPASPAPTLRAWLRCDKGCHLQCAGLAAVPKGQWFCSLACKKAQAAREKVKQTDELLGKKLTVYWVGNDMWFTGKVTDVDLGKPECFSRQPPRTPRMHLVHYECDDDEVCFHPAACPSHFVTFFF